jgi:hypothetical protein
MALDKFHIKLREYLRAGGYSQKQLAYELDLAPTFLSNKLHQHNFATLTLSEIKQIVKILAEWGVLTSQRQALELLALMNLSYSSFTPQEWQAPPLAQLELAAAPYPAFEEVEREELEAVNVLPYRSRHSGSLKLVPSPRLKQQLAQLPIPLRLPPRREDWQGTIQTGPLYNRVEEMAKLKRWVLEEQCRIVAVLGMGGMGKTALTIQLAQQLKAQFEFVI